MTTDEANKIILKFMGIDESDFGKQYANFSNSLDSIVPVWDKLGENASYIELFPATRWVGIENERFKQVGLAKCETIQEAAAIATAKAIQELGE